MGDETLQGIGEIGAGRIEDGEMVETGGAGRWRPTARAFPGIEADMVMIAAGRDEGGLIAHFLDKLEAEHAAIEIEGALDIATFRCTWPMRVAAAIGADADAAIGFS